MPQQSLRPRASGITLWRPEIVLAETMTPGAWRPRVLIAEPALRPEAVKAQIEATGSALGSLAEARRILTSRAAASEARAMEVDSDRERVAAMIEAYRVKTALDDILRGTLRQVTALMEERGLR
ncbi:MAG: hypothetical protein AUH29_06605 [Candidatus Rokubacteria bacterium 13_1_40CM_69_27]|nr:MAG: hypothetical protein AUH29_06605 [Candidatus Rokubacteria bacterium 13_1_40CM_69_27]OLC35922.1 MAG: hypothetical protein AUH81_08920 [Candidatus Rokubacteria bacterium 13_1_40CM_4_69_5]OLE38761.1 MAG: hypothetical protein AUG00_04570 [Candidatus Rokubacteria bacterium 13_1_20CM_2_70_7]